MTSATQSAQRHQRNARGQGTRLADDIVRGALALVERTGSDEAVTLRAVAREVGIAAPSIYAHFADREAIIMAAVVQVFDELAAAIEKAEAAVSADPVQRLLAGCQAYLEFGLGHPARYGLLFALRGVAAGGMLQTGADGTGRRPRYWRSGPRRSRCCCRPSRNVWKAGVSASTDVLADATGGLGRPARSGDCCGPRCPSSPGPSWPRSTGGWSCRWPASRVETALPWPESYDAGGWTFNGDACLPRVLVRCGRGADAGAGRGVRAAARLIRRTRRRRLRAAPASQTAAGAGTAATAGPSRPLPPSPSCPATVLASMTEAQRIGQLFLVGLPDNEVAGTVAETITAHHFGSVIFGADSKGGITGARQVAGAVQALTSRSATDDVRFFVRRQPGGRRGSGADRAGYLGDPVGAGSGIGSAPRADVHGLGWGDQLRSAGVNLNLAPVLDVVPAGTERSNAPIGALDREYGNDPATVSAHGVAFLRGMASAGIATSAKHFPGLGRVAGNTDFTSSVVDTVTAATDPYLQTYQAAINAGVPLVMVALATYTRIDPHELAVFSPTVINGLLRQRMHFTGTILSDDMGVAAAVAGISPGQRAISFVSAGGDLIATESLPVADEMDAALLARAAASSAFRAEVERGRPARPDDQAGLRPVALREVGAAPRRCARRRCSPAQRPRGHGPGSLGSADSPLF